MQKANGKYRLLQDFRPLNSVMEKDARPLLRIIDILHRKGKQQIWSKLDLVDGYHQMPLKKEHQLYTCSATPLRSNAMDRTGDGAQKRREPIPKNDGMGYQRPVS